MLWALWYATTIAAAFVWIAGGVAGSRLSLGECISGAVAVGTIGGAWAIYFAACVTGSLTPLSIFGGTALMVIAAAAISCAVVALRCGCLPPQQQPFSKSFL